jgi:hypothetical protein
VVVVVVVVVTGILLHRGCASSRISWKLLWLWRWQLESHGCQINAVMGWEMVMQDAFSFWIVIAGMSVYVGEPVQSKAALTGRSSGGYHTGGIE